MTTLYSFSGGTDGGQPYGGVVQGTDGNFYGTTSFFGSATGGTVFKITPGGTLTTLYRFSGFTDGALPVSGLIQASDGNFYGTTTQDGGANGNGSGTVFKITASGTLTTLHSFGGPAGVNSLADGGGPKGGLVQGTDGNFYGTTLAGGINNNGYGTVFKITPGGTLTTLHSFSDTSTDGGVPQVALVQASDGNFYGTTSQANDGLGLGTVFKITPDGTLTTLHSFSTSNRGVDGSGPCGLVLASDGKLYGMTSGGGANGEGTVFSLGLRAYFQRHRPISWRSTPTTAM